MAKLTFFERQIIEHGLHKGKSQRAIAKILDRDPSVIRREIEHNSGDYLPYTSASAQRISERRERNRRQPKLEKDLDLRAHVITELGEGQSPEQIAGALQEHPPELLRGKHLCHETIYQYIYAGEGRYEYLYSCLRRKQPRRRKQRARKPRKATIIQRVSIHERSVEVAKKKTYGHWESDSMSCKQQKETISVQYERKAQLVRIHKVADKSAKSTEMAIRDTIASLPQHLFKTMTFDNGGEGACHTKLRDDYMLQTYFCDAYASWQKGGVENINGLIREYIPKEAHLAEMTDEDIYAIQEKLNNRPRKGLNYLTPNQVIAAQVGRC